MDAETKLVRVEWDDSECGCDGPLPPETVLVPLDVYYAGGTTHWSDPVADWLSNRYGFLVVDWMAE